jgi:sugar lactone lactonase YvrE
MTALSRFLTRALLVCALSAAVFGGQTRTWSQGDFSDFEKGVIKDLSVRSDGVVTLAPRTREFSDTSAMYLWSLARDSRGNLYTGGGTGAKLYRIATDGKNRVLAELDGLEIHAVAVDSKDRVYAATAPDGKVYRVSANGKAEVFYDPHAKYIWALAFDRQDNLYVATGDKGELHRVAPDGKGKVFFQCEETHVRSLAVDPNGNIIVGTEPGGLVLRISPAGEGFVLYQMPKREVTAIAVSPDGAIYAAGVASRQASPPGSILQTSLPERAPTPVSTPSGGAPGAPRQAAPALPLTTAPLGVNGGSDVYQIDPGGSPRRVWSSSRDVVYALAFDHSGHLLLGAGNRGNVYRIESPTLYTALLTVPATQVTAFQAGSDGRLYVATGNIGKIYEISPEPESQGTLESDVFDAGLFTRWGRLTFDAVLKEGKISIQTRSGNLDQPQKNWSPWSAPISDPKGDRIGSPAARFVQWKATLTAAGAKSPELNSVDMAYLPKNVEPHVDRIEITPANYRFPAQVSVTSVQTMSLPPLISHNARPEAGATLPSSSDTTAATITPAMQFAKGFIGARWMAADPNNDSLVYTVEIRGLKEKEWKLLKDKLTEKYYSWDSTAFPDGEYRIRVTASDSPSNPPDDALTGRLESDPFIIDNTPPQITGLTAARPGNKLQVRWHAADALNNIQKAEYSLDGGDWTFVAPTTGLSDSLELDYDLTVDAGPGEHTIAVRVEDSYANLSTDKAVVQ